MNKIILFSFLMSTLGISAQTFSDWNRRQSIIIDHNQVEGTSSLVDFPVLVTLDHLNSEVVDGGVNSALNGGGDIRFSNDSAGNNRLAIEVVEFVTSVSSTERRCQIWVKIPTLSAITSTTIYIWYNKSGETQPVITDPYGSQAVWSSNYVSIWHMEEDPNSTAPQIKDSGSGSNDGITGGGMESNDSVDSQIGNGINLNGTNQFVNVGNSASLNLTSELTISGWFNPEINADMYLMAKRNETIAEGYNVLLFGQGDFGVYDTTAYWNSDATWEYTINQWNYVVIKINTLGTEYTGFLNGIFGSEKTIPAFSDGLAQNLYLGARSNGAGLPFNGSIDEFRVSNIARSNDWVATEYNNQSNSLTFASAGTPEPTSSDTQDPTAPTLSSTAQTDTTADLSWTAATDNTAVTGYKVYKNAVLGTTLGNVLSYQVTGLTASTVYNFTVTALDAAGNESVVSNTLAITTNAQTDTQAPTAPTVSSTIHTDTTADLSWTAATDNTAVTGYKVYKDAVIETTLGNVLSYQVTGLAASTAYDFTVTALDAAGNESVASNTLAITTNATLGGGSGNWTLNNQNVYYNTGNVGIGTNTPDEKLAVNGNIHAKEVRVDLSGWPDYVFTKTYDLRTLKQVAEYIKAKGHLPNIPSAKEVEENGILLGDMNAKLLEKIEELTLYILQHQKELEAQKVQKEVLEIKLEQIIKRLKE